MSRRFGILPLAAAAVLGIAAAACGPLPITVEITLKHSRFTPSAVNVPAGVPVTFVIRNEDPIDHEWIVGEPDVHERHRTGTEPVHDEKVTEVTVPALETRTTTITFDKPGLFAIVCHLPRHEAYGMVGSLRVQ